VTCTDLRKEQAERLCSQINARLGWRGANPEYRRESVGYTGAIVLSQRGAAELLRLTDQSSTLRASCQSA
jgi:hypothetical protein